MPIFPGGEVFAGLWGSSARAIHERIDDTFEQTLTRVLRPIGGARQGGQWQWLCPAPGCGAMCFKLYLPGRPFTVGEFLGREAPDAAAPPLIGGRFVCRTCAGLVYESTERTSRDSAGRRVDPFDRFVQRITAGLLRAADVVSSEISMAIVSEVRGQNDRQYTRADP